MMETLRLDLADIVEASRAATGLADPGDPDIMPALQLLIDSLVNEAHLHAQGMRSQRAALIGLVSNRLRIADSLRRHPQVREGGIRGPVIITGLARSGTTKLQRMMAADPGLQTLPLWRLLNPMPLGPAAAGGRDPRIAITESVSNAMRDQYPEFYAGHPMNANDPDEETLMADLAMRGSYNCHAMRIPSFDAWMRQQDHGVWYRFLHTMLQLFQWQDGSPEKVWLLKAPAHLGYLSTLLEVFPRATVVHCHRDPATSLASMAKLTVSARRMTSDFSDPEEVGRFVLDWWSWKMQRCMRQRTLLESQHRFVDVAYGDITGNAMAAIERIYAVAGMPLAGGARAAMTAWEAANPSGKHGLHHYAAEQPGLDPATIRAGFADYLHRFGGYF